jgi:predicted TIM-barrel fold metal-dependent hydrolase
VSARGAPGAGGAPAQPGPPYIDVHVHIGDTINRTPPVGQSAETFVGRMAQSGVVAGVLCPAAGGPQARGVADTRDQNEAIAAACRRWPERFPVGLTVVEVRHLRPGVDELERAMDASGLAGFMVHPGISGHQLGPVLDDWLEVVDARDGLVLLHIGGGRTEAGAAALARRYRRASFIMAHVSMTPAGHRAAVEHLAGLDNVWADFAQHPAEDDPGWDLADLVRHFGPERLVFGSDSPYFDHRRLQAQIERAALPEAIKDGIAHANAVRLIRRFRPEWSPPAAPPEVPATLAGVDLWREQPGQPGRLL